MKFQELEDHIKFIRNRKADIPDAEVDYLTRNCEKRLLTHEQATNVTEMIPVEPAPITGWRKLLIKWRLWNQYCAECRAAGV